MVLYDRFFFLTNFKIVESVTHYLVLGINLNSDHYLKCGLNLCFFVQGTDFKLGLVFQSC